VSDELVEMVQCWGRWPIELDNLFRASLSGLERASRLAELLQPLTAAGLSACQLSGETDPMLAWTCTPGPEGERCLREGLARLDPCSEQVVHLEDLERVLKVSSQIAAVSHAGRGWGFLILAHPQGTSPARLAVSEQLLLEAARTLALYFRLDTEAASRQHLLVQFQESAHTILVGDAVLALVHDVNNYLNQMVLQTAVVQMSVDKQQRTDLGLIRDEGRKAAELLRPLQRSWEERRKAAEPIDLNRLMSEVRAAEPDGPARLRLELGTTVPPVRGDRGVVRRLVRLLMLASLAHQSAVEPVLVRTWSEDEQPRLTVEQNGPALSERGQADLFDAEEGVFARSGVLERLAIQSLLRQCGATLRATPAEGWLALTVVWS
jgi:hypothetical protein